MPLQAVAAAGLATLRGTTHGGSKPSPPAAARGGPCARRAPRRLPRPVGACARCSVATPATTPPGPDPGTAADTVLPRLDATLTDVLAQRDALEALMERALDLHPLAAVLTSMAGVGVRTGASSIPAAYAGLAP